MFVLLKWSMDGSLDQNSVTQAAAAHQLSEGAKQRTGAVATEGMHYEAEWGIVQ
jgi:hypothetical protein